MAKEYKNNLFQVITHIDKKDYGYLQTLTEEQVKEIQPYVLMKWLSSAPMEEIDEYYTLAVNETVNTNFWQLSKYKDLQWKLMCACGIGKFVKHQWISSVSAPKDKQKLLLRTFFQHLNNQEFEDKFMSLTDTEKTEILQHLGAMDK